MYPNKELFSVGTQSKDVIQKMPTEKKKQYKTYYVKVSCKKSRTAVNERQTDGYIKKIRVPTRYEEVRYKCASCFEVQQTDV